VLDSEKFETLLLQNDINDEKPWQKIE